jgi:phospholipid/cholesterol/gamma-HCH transport system permease protein
VVLALGRWVISSYFAVEEFLYLFVQSLWAAFTPPFRIQDIIRQLHFVANQSLFIVVFCVTFAAAVTIIEASFHMKIVVKNDSMVPGFAALLILRELGTVVALLLLTSRVGAGLAAEVGSMKVTEQIDALKMLGIDPIRFLVVPRLWACVLGGAVISIFSNIVCLIGAMLVSIQTLNYTAGSFLTAMKRFVVFQDLMFATIKGGVFGAVIPLVSCYYGFRCKAGAEGVGLATTNSVVTSSVAIIILDFFLAWLFSFFY